MLVPSTAVASASHPCRLYAYRILLAHWQSARPGQDAERLWDDLDVQRSSTVKELKAIYAVAEVQHSVHGPRSRKADDGCANSAWRSGDSLCTPNGTPTHPIAPRHPLARPLFLPPPTFSAPRVLCIRAASSITPVRGPPPTARSSPAQNADVVPAPLFVAPSPSARACEIPGVSPYHCSPPPDAATILPHAPSASPQLLSRSLLQPVAWLPAQYAAFAYALPLVPPHFSASTRSPLRARCLRASPSSSALPPSSPRPLSSAQFPSIRSPPECPHPYICSHPPPARNSLPRPLNAPSPDPNRAPSPAPHTRPCETRVFLESRRCVQPAPARALAPGTIPALSTPCGMREPQSSAPPRIVDPRCVVYHPARVMIPTSHRALLTSPAITSHDVSWGGSAAQGARRMTVLTRAAEAVTIHSQPTWNTLHSCLDLN
ncbi:hypothetical protein DFH09DRAFT_1396401 [Mycena vulgaris]|nr:hypothetical protein DFH09DRAFT_1396401 [Mycena vulgaris]